MRDRAHQDARAGHELLQARFLALYESRAARLTRPYPSVPETLAGLAAEGWIFALCTNKPERATRILLRELDLDRWFHAIVTGDIDVALTCSPVSEPAGIATEVFCAEPLVVGLRPSHRLARRDTVRAEAQSVTMGPRLLAYRLFPVGQGMGVAFRDITASRTAELEASLAHAVAAQTAAFDRLAVGIVQLGAGGSVLSANRAARRIDGEADGLSIKATLRARSGPDNVRLRAAIAKEPESGTVEVSKYRPLSSR